MRIGPNDTFWVVTDPTADSTLDDILFETTLAGLERQFKGGLTMDTNPTIFTDRDEAKREGRGRMIALRISQVVTREAAAGKPVEEAWQIQFLDAGGAILFGARLR